MGCAGPIEIEMQVRLDAPDRNGAKRETCLTYQVAIDQDGDRPYVAFERCSYTDDESESIEARVAFEISAVPPMRLTMTRSRESEIECSLAIGLALAQSFLTMFWYREEQIVAGRDSDEGTGR